MRNLLLCAVAVAQSVAALDTTVNLGYAQYRGKDIGKGILRWAGMRYARSVSRVDGLRFTAPQDPLEERNVVDATKVRTCAAMGADATQTNAFVVWTALYWQWKPARG